MSGILNNLFLKWNASSFGQRAKVFLKTRNSLKPIYAFASQRLIDYRYPLTFNLEPTSACNLRCIMCPREQSKKKAGFMDFEVFKKVVDESKLYGPRHFILYKDGEPMLHPLIAQMVAYIKMADPKNTTYISTNGLLMDENKAAALIKAGVDQIQVSVNAAKEETYRKIRGEDLKVVEDNIKGALAIKKALGLKKPVISLQIIRMRETLDEIDLFIDKWKDYAVEIVVPAAHGWDGAKGDFVLDQPQKAQRYPCAALWFAPSINWDGTVSICCVDWNVEELLGNIKDSSLASMWQGEKIRLYRKYHLTNQYAKIPICANCTSYKGDRPNFWFSWQYKR